jgi:small subunit ribosomal protein S4
MKEADRKEGMSGEILLQLLEQRLDNAVYRAGFAISRRQSRQLVSHGHFILNGRRVDIPSIRVKAGDVISVRPHSVKTAYFASLDEIVKDATGGGAGWLKSNPKKMTIEITGLPNREDAEPDINEQLIVEYYSR